MNDNTGSPYSDDMNALTRLLDGLPIYATRIGFHSNSTDEERAFANHMFDLHRQWNEWKAE